MKRPAMPCSFEIQDASPGPRACSVRLHRLRVYIRKCWFSIYGCSCVQQVFYFFLLTGLHTCSYCIFNVHVSSIADSIDVLHLFPDYFQTSWAQHDMKTAQLVVWDIFPIQDGETQPAEAELFHQVMRGLTDFYRKRGPSWLQLSSTKWFARFYQHFRPHVFLGGKGLGPKYRRKSGTNLMWYHKFLIVSYIDVLPRFFPPDFIIQRRKVRHAALWSPPAPATSSRDLPTTRYNLGSQRDNPNWRKMPMSTQYPHPGDVESTLQTYVPRNWCFYPLQE